MSGSRMRPALRRIAEALDQQEQACGQREGRHGEERIGQEIVEGRDARRAQHEALPPRGGGEREGQDAGEDGGCGRNGEARRECPEKIGIDHCEHGAKARQHAEGKRPDEEGADDKHDYVEDLQASVFRIRPMDQAADRVADGRTGKGPVQETRHRQADRKLDQGEPGDAAEIEIDLERLEDRHFERRAARSAAERQHDGEALEAHQEDQAGDAGKFRAQDRPVEMAEDLKGREA